MNNADTYVVADNIISPLGWTTAENFEALVRKETGIKSWQPSSDFPYDHSSAIITSEQVDDSFAPMGDPLQHTKLEKICIASIQDALQESKLDVSAGRVGFIFSTTKGNINLLLEDNTDHINPERTYLFTCAQHIANYFKFKNNPIVISNACISGVVALITAGRFIRSGLYDHVVVCGADLVTPFTLTGFNALKALSPDLCKPFDRDRAGINLGEAAATVILSNASNEDLPMHTVGGSVSNDANHISGPSRTASGMQLVIQNTIQNYHRNIDLISAHGTATLYNDEMESIALDSLKLSHVPIHSLKGYYGHTLGAAGVIESIIGYRSVLNNLLIKSIGFKNQGTTHQLNIIQENKKSPLTNFLKTSSGFGGCNAAILFEQD